MTDRSLPHACAVANDVITELTMHSQLLLADRVATIHRATCDLAHAVWAERQAVTKVEKDEAAYRVSCALATLHG